MHPGAKGRSRGGDTVHAGEDRTGDRGRIWGEPAGCLQVEETLPCQGGGHGDAWDRRGKESGRYLPAYISEDGKMAAPDGNRFTMGPRSVAVLIVTK